jgi:hypothetical protein
MLKFHFQFGQDIHKLQRYGSFALILTEIFINFKGMEVFALSFSKVIRSRNRILRAELFWQNVALVDTA